MLIGPSHPFWLLALCLSCGYDREKPIPFVAWMRWHHDYLLKRGVA